MEDHSWHFRETLKHCHTFLVNEYGVISTVHDLVHCLFEQGHVTFNECQDVYKTPVTRDKMQLLIGILIKRKPFAIEDAFNCLVQHLIDSQYYNLASKLEDTLKEVKKLPKAPEMTILEKVMYLKENTYEEPMREIQRCLEEVAEYIIQSQTVEGSSGQTAASTASQTPDEAFLSLLEACEQDNLDRVQKIIEESPECINNINQNGQSALMVACTNSSVQIVRALLLSCDVITSNLKDVDGHTALMNSAKRGDVEVLCEMLDSEKVDVSVADDIGLTYLWYLFGSEIPTHLLTIALMVQHSSKIVDEWKVLEVDILMYLSKIKNLKKAIKWEKIVDVVKCLLSHRKVNQTDLLKLCFLLGNSETLEPILSSGKFEICSDTQRYCYAVTSVNPEILDVLCEFGFINMSELHRVEVEAIMESTMRSNNRDLCGFVYGTVRGWKVNDALKTALFLQSIPPGSLPVVLEGDKHDLNQQDPSGTSVFALLCKYGHHDTVSELLKLPHIHFTVLNNSGQSPFMVSLMNSDNSVPKLLWDSPRVQSVHIDVNHCDNYNTSTLAYVCASCNLDMVTTMLSPPSCHTLNVNIQDDMGLTALSYVCLSGMHHLAAELVELDVVFLAKLEQISIAAATTSTNITDFVSEEINKIDFKEVSLKDMIVKINRIHKLAPVISRSIKCNNNPIALMLLSLDNIDLTVRDNLDNTLLMLACLWGDDIVVSKLVDSKQTNLNAVNSSGATALTLACIGNNGQVVGLLLTKKVESDKADRSGCTPLMYSCLLGHSGIISLLLSKGANINATNIYGASVLMCTCICGTTDTVEILLQHGVDIDAKDVRGTTILLYVCLLGKTEMLKLLLGRNVSIDAMNVTILGITALMAVCLFCGVGSADIVELLLTHNALVDVRNSHQMTALFLACHCTPNVGMTVRKFIGSTYSSADNCKIVQKLLTRHADKNARDEGGNTPLLMACYSDKPEIVAILLSNQTDINMSNKKGRTPLMVASTQGNINIVQQLLRFPSHNVDVNAEDDDGDSALHGACDSEKTEPDIVARLLEAKADINKRNVNGLTPLMSACYAGNVAIVDLLVRNNADVNEVIDLSIKGCTPLNIAVLTNNVEIVRILLANKANVNAVDSKGNTVLTDACAAGNVEIVKILLANKANVNAVDSNGNTVLIDAIISDEPNIAIIQLLAEAQITDINKKLNGFTPLMIACPKGNVEVVKILLANNANVNMAYTDGSTVLHFACHNIHINPGIVGRLLEAKADINKENVHGLTPLAIACKAGNVEIVKILLANINVNVNAVNNNGDTVLIIAINTASDERNIEIIQLLVEAIVEANANINKSDMKGYTPLMYAVCKSDDYANIVELLVQAGADINCRMQGGITPLMFCCIHGHTNTVRVLLNNKAEVDVLDQYDCTALFYACMSDKIDTVKLILQAGGDVNVANKAGETPLAWSRSRNNTEIVELLLDCNRTYVYNEVIKSVLFTMITIIIFHFLSPWLGW